MFMDLMGYHYTNKLTPAKVYQSINVLYCNATNQLPTKCRHHEAAKF